MRVSPLHKIFILRELQAAGDAPQPETSLRGALRAAFPAPKLHEADLTDVIRAVEAEGWITSIYDELLQMHFWSLTLAGRARASNL